MRTYILVPSLMLMMALVALDTTAVGTAMPTVVGNLGGLSLFSWVFSAYLLTSTVTVPLYGKLADLYGRKPVLLFGAGLFVAASALCGTSQNMEQLIAYRALQGLGAGAVLPVTMTIIGDVFSLEQRARVQGLFSSVWGISSVAGPALGGVITDSASWRWVFLINLPIGVAAMSMVFLHYKEQVTRRSHVLDYWGTVLFSAAVTILLVSILEVSRTYGWTSPETIGLFAMSALLMAGFFLLESRVPEPTVPLGLFRNRLIAVATVAGFITGAMQFGVSSYVPLFSQGVSGGTAIDAGLVLAPMSIGWPIASVLGGRLILRLGYYPIILAGSALLIAGSVMLLGLGRDSPQGYAMASVFVVGLGMGFTFTSFVISVQNAVDWAQRGIATASTQFTRSIGGAIMVAVMGAILNSQMADRMRTIDGSPQGDPANILLDVDRRSSLAPEVLESMRQALASSLHDIYFLVLGGALISFAIVFFFPRGQPHELAHAGAGATPPGPPLGGSAQRAAQPGASRPTLHE